MHALDVAEATTAAPPPTGAAPATTGPPPTGAAPATTAAAPPPTGAPLAGPPSTGTTAAPPDGGLAPPGASISVRGLVMRFGRHTVLDDVSFDVPRGSITAVLGPSGTGKSVLLKAIIGLLRPQRGHVYIDGEEMTGLSERQMLAIRRKFGVLFQDGALFGSLDLYENIAFPLREHTSLSEDEIRDKVAAKSELVGLGSHLGKLPGEVSGGMRKRAGLARAMVLDPDIVFLDEPDSGLDPVRVAYLDDLVKTAQAETGATFFLITHNIESVNRVADNMGLLFRSRLVAFGARAEMNADANPVLRQFFAGRAEGPIGMDEMVDS